MFVGIFSGFYCLNLLERSSFRQRKIPAKARFKEKKKKKKFIKMRIKERSLCRKYLVVQQYAIL